MAGDDCSPTDMDEVGEKSEWRSGGSSTVYVGSEAMSTIRPLEVCACRVHLGNGCMCEAVCCVAMRCCLLDLHQ